MGASDGAPFLYDRPQSWNFGAPTSRGFNPRAATEASWSPKPQRPMSNGPLVDFNKHPDSYLVVPYGQLGVQPMHPNTKSNIVRARTAQLVLRWGALLGALGLLFCVIAINKTTRAVAWIIRVAPAVAICHTFYAVYHLSRGVNSRTPGSTASYMVFAGMVDLGLIPFCAFSSYLSYLDYTQNIYEWSTLFGDGQISYKIIFAFFILNTTEGGLLLLSLFLNIWLAITFRKIAKMPPDMNPLEENLTSRFGHKRNKSSMNITEKHMSASTLVTNSNRDSGNGRRVPFIHTRTDSADSVTLYGNQSARNSRVEMRKGFEEVTNDPYRMSGNSLPGSPLRPNLTLSPAPNARPAGHGLDYRPGRSSALNDSPQRSPDRSPERPSSWLSYLDYEGCPTDISDEANEELDREVRSPSPVSAISSPTQGQMMHAWSTHPSAQTSHQYTSSNPKRDVSHAAALMAQPLHPPTKRSREPLGMNPPSPVKGEFEVSNENSYSNGHIYGANDPASSPARQALSPTDGNSRASSFVGSGGKSRFYGDLRASIGSMGAEQRKMADTNVTEIYLDNDKFEMYSNGIDRSKTTKSAQSASDYSGNIEIYASDSEEDVPALPPQYQYQQQNPYANRTSLQAPNNESHYAPTPPLQNTVPRKPVGSSYNSPRQISNSTGLDLHTGYAGLGPEFGRGMARRRDVSGKVAEEGRGGHWEDKHEYETVVEELTPKKQQPIKSAGWARFKGL